MFSFHAHYYSCLLSYHCQLIPNSTFSIHHLRSPFVLLLILSAANCRLLTAFLPPTAFCLPPIASLPADCLLLTAYCFLPANCH
jgi:hypothetical protein